MNQLKQLIELITDPQQSSLHEGEARANIEALATASSEQVSEFLNALLERLNGGGKLREKLLAGAFRQLVFRAHQRQPGMHLFDSTQVRVVEALYCKLGSESSSRHALLQLLTASQDPEALRIFAELIVEDPPTDGTQVAMAFGPLLQHKEYDASQLFPRLLDALGHSAVAPYVMDLANFVTREHLLDVHPAYTRREQLGTLLGALVQRLAMIEEQPYTVSQDDRELAGIVSQSVSLGVSLCDALGLIGDPASMGKLNQVLELRHRRLRTEAAAALARLGDENGKEVLVSLAAEPVARLRVLAYADELNLQGRIREEFATPAARAEAELALWLSEPTQLGFPPSNLELIDSQTFYWPGFDEPVDCFLFRFSYEVGEGEYANIGIAGPMCHAFAADLADLPPDDIYAVFAGWQAEHEEVYEVAIEHLSESQRVDVARLERRVRDYGCDKIAPIQLGYFFGDKALVATAVREGQSGIAVSTMDEVFWLNTQGRRRPLGAQEAYSLFKGRRLLRAFNEGKR